MDELRPGLRTWTRPHPSWTSDDGGPEGWEQEVRSYALDAEESLVLFDPLVVAEVVELAAGRPIDVVSTCRWHKRSSAELVDSAQARVHVPARDAAELGIPAVPYSVGDELPGGVEAHFGGCPNEGTLWIARHRALVTGDVLLGGGVASASSPTRGLRTV